MAIGVSGCGKTRLHFDIARQRLAIYIECVGRRVHQTDVALFYLEAHRPLDAPHVKTERAMQLFRLLIWSRVITLLLFADKIAGQSRHEATAFATSWSLPDNFWEQWLLAQLDGACSVSKKIFETLTPLAFTMNGVGMYGNAVHGHLARLEKAIGHRLVFLMDEVHEWNQNSCFTSPVSSVRTGRTLLNVTMATLTEFERSSLWSGTALGLRDVRNLPSSMAAGAQSPAEILMEQLEFGFDPLNASEVIKLFAHFVQNPVLTAEATAVIGTKLQGRARLPASFVGEVVADALRRKIRVLDEVGIMACSDKVLTAFMLQAKANWTKLFTGYLGGERGGRWDRGSRIHVARADMTPPCPCDWPQRHRGQLMTPRSASATAL